MKHCVIVSFLVFAFFIACAQAPPEYSKWVAKADSLYKVNDYKNSGNAFSQAFQSFGWKGYVPDRYRAAVSWAHASIPDSAFSNLVKIATKAAYSDYDHITNDKNLVSLRTDLRWKLLLDKIWGTKILITVIDSLVTEDQKWRTYIVRFDNRQMKDDTTSREYIGRWLRKTDSLNFFVLQKIFRQHGFPNYEQVGQNGSHNFWLLMQHQDLHPQFQEEVLAKMKEEADKGKALMTDYVYLLDRVKVNTNQLQVYGTQMTINSTGTSYEPKPTIDPERLNERRKSVGLDSIESYTETMNTRYFGTLKK
jgi:hypothetical protein